MFSQAVVDSFFRQKSIDNTIRIYSIATGLQARLYNGPLYQPYPRAFTEGHQYLSHDSLTNGSVSYDGLEYHDIPMRYDIIRDELIIYPPNGFALNLIKQKVDSFLLLNRRFIKLMGNKVPGTVDSIGYYEKLYSSPTIAFLAKRVKTKEETTAVTRMEIVVYPKTFYYILKDGVLHPIRNKKSLMEILEGKKAETQQYIKNNKLRFKQFEQDVLQTIIYYDQLK